MSLTPHQIAERRWGRPGDLPRTIPRNPTESDRAAGSPALSAAEWATLRDWQRKTIRRWTLAPDAMVRHRALLASWPPAGHTLAEDLPLLSPEPPVRSEIAHEILDQRAALLSRLAADDLAA